MLDRLAGPGLDLLGRVDACLARYGAPAGHPVLGLIRDAGLTPGEALAFAVSLDDGPFRRASLPVPGPLPSLRDVTWDGAARDAFETQWTAVVRQQEALAERMAATRAYAEAVVEWVGLVRRSVAEAVGTALGSMEAVRVKTESDPLAAAEIGAVVLRAAVRPFPGGVEWAGRLSEVEFVAPGRGGGRAGRGFSVAL